MARYIDIASVLEVGKKRDSRQARDVTFFFISLAPYPDQALSRVLY